MRLARGQDAEAAEHLDRALASARQLVALTPEDPRALDALCSTLEKLGSSERRPALTA